MGNPIPSSDARGHWVTMACPICGVGSKERCLDTMGHQHPSSHPERRVWSACEALIRADAYEQAAKKCDEAAVEADRKLDAANNEDSARNFAAAHATSVVLAIEIRALSDQPDSTDEGLAELLRENAELRQNVIAFCAPWAFSYARDCGLPDGHLHPIHYDILKNAGGRMDSFVRGDLSTGRQT